MVLFLFGVGNSQVWNYFLLVEIRKITKAASRFLQKVCLANKNFLWVISWKFLVFACVAEA